MEEASNALGTSVTALVNVDTIVAETTPPGRGGVGIIRLSGPKAIPIAEKIIGALPQERIAEHRNFLNVNSEVIDKGLVIFFKGPKSFTGEDVIEFQGHGSPIVVETLIQEIIGLGARLANPGEFTERAFLNDKLDLLQAEAVCDLISATSRQAAKAALASLQGDFSTKIYQLVEEIIRLRMYVEAAIDFPEEELDLLSDKHIETTLFSLMQQLESISKTAAVGARLQQGIKVVIAGPPNAGKSSLLNRLSGLETAIVTDIPGTTRDLIRSSIALEGLLLELIDTAGIRETTDLIEQEGIKRAKAEMSTAHHVVWVLEADETFTSTAAILEQVPTWVRDFSKGVPVTVLCNKIDQTPVLAEKLNSAVKQHRSNQGLKNPLKEMGVETDPQNAENGEKDPNIALILISAKTGAGLDNFHQHLKKTSQGTEQSETIFMARQRHLVALNEAQAHLVAGQKVLTQIRAGELLAEELRLAQLSLDTITGRFTSDDLLGKIFSEFCVGK